MHVGVSAGSWAEEGGPSGASAALPSRPTPGFSSLAGSNHAQLLEMMYPLAHGPLPPYLKSVKLVLMFHLSLTLL